LHGTSNTPPDGCSCDPQEFAELTREVAGAEQIRAARATVVERAAALLGTPWVALTRPFEGDQLGFVALSAEEARTACRAEQRLHEGPGWDVHQRRCQVAADDLVADGRWPRYAELLAADTAIRSLVAVPLLSGPVLLGALIGYADRPGHFAGDRRHRAELLGAHVGAALGAVAARIKAANLEVALRTNREISTAVGIVMDRLRITDDQSFGYLRELSQRQHLKLSELAERIVVTGEVPAVPAGPPVGTAQSRARRAG
jgi:GAF domain-containing protein